MNIRKTTKISKGKTYTHYLLVESVHTPKGPRQRTICSLGSLGPGPLEQWHALARKVEASLAGQLSLEPTALPMEPMVDKAPPGPKRPRASTGQGTPVDPEQVALEEAREAGPVHVGHQMWHQLGLEAILRRAGLSAWARLLSEVMTLNRLICPLSEHATPDWLRQTALGDILGTEFATLTEDALYRNLDKLHPHREQIERELATREHQLFHLDETIYLYDLTSTYFEGQAGRNRQAKRGYSRDKRSDCKQVLVGLVLDRDGFPKAHEIFAGNRQDRSTVPEMLERLKQRTGQPAGATVVVDRGMAYEENLAQIRAQGLHYMVAGRQAERDAWLAELEADDWEEVYRTPSPRNPHQRKSRVQIKRRQQGHEVYVSTPGAALSGRVRLGLVDHAGFLRHLPLCRAAGHARPGHPRRADRLYPGSVPGAGRLPGDARRHPGHLRAWSLSCHALCVVGAQAGHPRTGAPGAGAPPLPTGDRVPQRQLPLSGARCAGAGEIGRASCRERG